jgi:hypothetical protein
VALNLLFSLLVLHVSAEKSHSEVGTRVRQQATKRDETQNAKNLMSKQGQGISFNEI